MPVQPVSCRKPTSPRWLRATGEAAGGARQEDDLSSDLIPGLHCLTAGVPGWFQKGMELFWTMPTMSVSGEKSSRVKRFLLNLKPEES